MRNACESSGHQSAWPLGRRRGPLSGAELVRMCECSAYARAKFIIPNQCMIFWSVRRDHILSGASPHRRFGFTHARRTGRLSQLPAISIIDDDASVRSATNRLVRSFGYVAHTFSSAADFLRSGHVNNTSCVITDVQMPGMSGIDLQSLLIAQGHSMPIIFITAFPDENVRRGVLKAGAVCLLTKPFDGCVLIKCIDAALRKRGSEAFES